MPLRAVLLCHFHYEQGAQLVFQSPRGYLSREDFREVSRFVIPKPEFFGKEFNMSLAKTSRIPSRTKAEGSEDSEDSEDKDNEGREKVQLIFFPMIIKEEGVYFRNSLMYAPIFVCDTSDSPSLYSRPIFRLASALRVMEEDAQVLTLSIGDCRKEMKEARPANSTQLQSLLDNVLTGLQTNEGSHGLIEGEDDAQQHIQLRFSLRIPSEIDSVPEIRADQVPFVVSRRALQFCASEDIACLRVAKYIDGRRTAARISIVAHMELNLTYRVLRCLVFARAVVMTDPLLVCNVWTTTPALSTLIKTPAMLIECQQFVSKRGKEAPMKAILDLYAQFSPAAQLTPFVFTHDARNHVDLQNIHLRRFFQYGSLRKLLHCVRSYPVLSQPAPSVTWSGSRRPLSSGSSLLISRRSRNGSNHPQQTAEVTEGGWDEGGAKGDLESADSSKAQAVDASINHPHPHEQGIDIAALLPLCDGSHSVEEICAIFQVGRATVRDLLFSDPRIELLQA